MIVNYLITNVNAKREKTISSEARIGISNSINITDVDKDEKFKILKFGFKFDVTFTGDGSDELGKIVISGFVVYTGEKIEEIYENWEDAKKRDESVNTEVLQAGLNISILEAMSVAKMLQLPPILPLPRVSSSGVQDESKHEGKKK